MTTQLAAPASEDDDQTGHDQTGRPHPDRGGRARLWQRLRMPLALVALVAVGGTVIALLAPRPKSNTYLDPASSDPSGTKALAEILANRGFTVIRAYSPASALSAVQAAGARSSGGAPAATLVITSPGLLTPAQRVQLAQTRSDLFLVEPRSASLKAFASAVSLAGQNGPFATPLDPDCSLRAAQLAGSADVAGLSYAIPAGAIGCYPVDGHPAVVRYASDGRTITILGNGQALSNSLLATDGNAALALNLLNGQHTIVWLTPEPTIARLPPQSARPAAPPLIPYPAWLIVLQLTVALLFAALWRVRRFGPLITERLPVVVRASETVEGHARLYQSRRARGRAAGALRMAVLARTKPAIGLAADAPLDAVVEALASRSSRSAAEITAILDGPAPATDAELVRLADDLDTLEREVRAQ